MSRLRLITLGALLLVLAIASAACGGPGPEKAALDAFQVWAQRAGIPYKDVSASVLKDDGTYATVRITAWFRERAEAEWEEKEADVEVRKVGGQWQAPTGMWFSLTKAQRERFAVATATAVARATATAEAQAAKTATAAAATETLLAELRKLGKIAFSRDDYVYLMGADGSNPIRLAEGGDPAWSPDGRYIAFVRAFARGSEVWVSEVWVMEADGSNQHRLTEGGDPAWSPDGWRIAYRFPEIDGNNEIYIVEANGSNPRNLTRHPAVFEGDPTWSPDGYYIAFSSNRDSDFAVFVMGSDGTNQHRLAAEGKNPSWSPDGRYIAFVSYRDGNGEIYIMEADGSNPRRIAGGYQPAWSPRP